jgi:dTDP-4-dehydrorhamnose reductase
MRVLITGARGLLGAAIAAAFADCEAVHALDHRALDVTDRDAVRAAIADAKTDVVVNCAAYNDVDGAEANAQHALSVNAFAVLDLARAARAHDAAFVHYSSDFVFDGTSGRPYTEDDEPNPRSVYASSKLLGDWFAAEAGRAYVLRVESLFGGPGIHAGARRGSLGGIVDRILADDEVPVFVDRTVSPSYTPDIATATRRLIDEEAPPGTYHCVNTGAATWAEVAQEAARLLGRTLRMKRLTLETVSLRAPRPKYCALSNARLASLGISMPTWQNGLRRYINSQFPTASSQNPL